MKNRDGLVNSNDWQTPQYLYDELNAEFHFDFDPCPYYADFDGLTIEWGNSNFINPPYDRVNKPKFIQKAFDEWQKGKTCVLLIPSATGTKQFHELILPNAEVRFVEGRVAFRGYNTKGEWSEKNKGKHDSMIVIFKKKEPENKNELSDIIGKLERVAHRLCVSVSEKDIVGLSDTTCHESLILMAIRDLKAILTKEE